MKHAILGKLRGALELVIFMKSGETVFRNTTFKSMLCSFIIPLLLIPYGIWGMSMTHGTELQELSELEGINNFSTPVFIAISILKGLLLTAFLITIMYYFAKFMERGEYFYDYLSAGNWTIVPSMLFSIPLLVMLLSGGEEWMSVYVYACMLILYNVAISAFITTRMLKLPWELGTACAIFGLMMGETANKIVNLIGTNYFS